MLLVVKCCHAYTYLFRNDKSAAIRISEKMGRWSTKETCSFDMPACIYYVVLERRNIALSHFHRWIMLCHIVPIGRDGAYAADGCWCDRASTYRVGSPSITTSWPPCIWVYARFQWLFRTTSACTPDGLPAFCCTNLSEEVYTLVKSELVQQVNV